MQKQDAMKIKSNACINKVRVCLKFNLSSEVHASTEASGNHLPVKNKVSQ